MAKITGIGGVFIKAKTDDKALREWYQKNLGIKLDDWGGCARWIGPRTKPRIKGVTAWMVAAPNTKWFSPSESSFMINYRIDNMDEMIAATKERGGVALLKESSTTRTGCSAWVMDYEGKQSGIAGSTEDLRRKKQESLGITEPSLWKKAAGEIGHRLGLQGRNVFKSPQGNCSRTHPV